MDRNVKIMHKYNMAELGLSSLYWDEEKCITNQNI